MILKMEGPATVGAVNRANIETASFLNIEYTADSEIATLHHQIALIRTRFGASDHLAAQLAALAFGGAA